MSVSNTDKIGVCDNCSLGSLFRSLKPTAFQMFAPLHIATPNAPLPFSPPESPNTLPSACPLRLLWWAVSSYHVVPGTEVLRVGLIVMLESTETTVPLN